MESGEFAGWTPTYSGWEKEDYPYLAWVARTSRGDYIWGIDAQTFMGTYWEPPEYDTITSGSAPSAWEAAEEANNKLSELYNEDAIW